MQHLTEHQHARLFADWLRSNHYFFHHSPNETYTPGKRQKLKNSIEGVSAGFPDYTIILKPKNKKIFPDKKIIFNTINPHHEPLLSIPDYILWAVQRLCEKQEIQYYEKIKEKIPLIIDIYDDTRYKNFQNYYNSKQKQFLTLENFIQ